MPENDNPQDEKVDNRSNTTPYDLGLFIAKSFGRSLPVVIIIALIAYGAWYGIHQVNEFQLKTIEAERQKNAALLEKQKAEDAAASAADRAKADALREYSTQLQNLNMVTADVSKRLEDLVSTQVDNMAKTDKRNEAQQERERKYEAQTAVALNDQLTNLRKQVADTQREASVAVYSDVKRKMAQQVTGGLNLNDQLLDLIGDQLDAPLVMNTAKQDAKDETQGWEMRVAIGLILFKKTSDRVYFDDACALLQKNKSLIRPVTTALFIGYNAFSNQQKKIVFPFLAELIDHGGLDHDVRDQLLTAFGNSWGFDIAGSVNQAVVVRLTSYAGFRLTEIALGSADKYYQLTSFLMALHALSPEAELVYATRALKSLSDTGGAEKLQAKAQLDAVIRGRQPTDVMLQQWPTSQP